MITTFEQAQEVLEATLPGYTRRPPQMGLAFEVERAIADEAALLAQAGTGTGKSLALTIPAILSGKKTVVGTPTRVLQAQYVRDMKFLEEHLGVDFKWAVLYGRYNYPCFAKAQQLTSPTPPQKAVLVRMDELSEVDPVSGKVNPAKILDRQDFPAMTEEEWKPFGMSAGECPGAKRCPFGEKCFAERAKARAAEANIVITNLAYLLQDLILRQRTGGNVALLGEIEQVIVDEAHMLPEVATGALEDTIGQGSLAVLGRDVDSWLLQSGLYDTPEEDPDEVSEVAGDSPEDEPAARRERFGEVIEAAGDSLWEALTRLYETFCRESSTTDPMELTINTLLDPEQLGMGFINAINAIHAARDAVKMTRALDERETIIRERLMRRTDTMIERLEAYATDAPEKTIRWAEKDVQVVRGERRERLFLRSAPIDVGPFLRTALWDMAPTILSSATLGGYKMVKKAQGVASGWVLNDRVADFSYLIETVGLRPGEARTHDTGSPFDYGSQATLYVPGEDAPSPEKKTNAEWRKWAQTVTHHLVTRAGGGALLLFTSRSALNESYEALAMRLRAEGLTVLRQGDLTNGELIRIMKEDGNAVLFALRSFFQGVDIQGHALRLVVIDKLPFTPPSDLVYRARGDALIRKYRNKFAGFDRLVVPSMVLDLTQAFGRLIRHRNDMGVVAILDNRLTTKRYGQNILAALPPAPRTNDLSEAVNFLEAITESQQ